MPAEYGYHGPIHVLVGMDLTGVLTGAIVDYDSEPYGYFSVQPPEFGAQFAGKSVRAPLQGGRRRARGVAGHHHDLERDARHP